MSLVAHDPFISEQVAATLGIQLLSLDELCGVADYITLHLPSTPETRHLFDAARFARCKPGVRIVNTARGELIDEGALADAIEARQVAGAGLDVFQKEPPADWRLAKLPQVVATPHIAASTVEAQEQVGIETAVALRDFLQEGVIRNAVNFPGIRGEEFTRVRPFILLAERMGALVAQLAEGRTKSVGIRYYGPARQQPCRFHRQRGRRRSPETDALVERHRRERACDCGRAWDRGRRVTQLANAIVRQHALSEAADDRRRMLD